MKHYLFAIFMAIALFSGCAEKEKTVKDICIEVGEEYFEKKLDKIEKGLGVIRFLKYYDEDNSNGNDPISLGSYLSSRLQLRLDEVLHSRPSVFKDEHGRTCYAWHKDGYLAVIKYLELDYDNKRRSSVELIIEKY